MKKWEKLQRGVEKACFSISHSHVKWNRMGFGYSILREKWKSNFAWPCKIFAQSCETLQKDENNVDGSSTSHHHAKLLGLVWKCIFSRFLDEEASERPLRWCQVSTRPWPINRNEIDSFKNFLIFPNCRTFQIYSLYIIPYFPSFSLIFSVAKHVLWDQISKHEWLNLVFLGGGRI